MDKISQCRPVGCLIIWWMTVFYIRFPHFCVPAFLVCIYMSNFLYTYMKLGQVRVLQAQLGPRDIVRSHTCQVGQQKNASMIIHLPKIPWPSADPGWKYATGKNIGWVSRVCLSWFHAVKYVTNQHSCYSVKIKGQLLIYFPGDLTCWREHECAKNRNWWTYNSQRYQWGWEAHTCWRYQAERAPSHFWCQVA